MSKKGLSVVLCAKSSERGQSREGDPRWDREERKKEARGENVRKGEKFGGSSSLSGHYYWYDRRTYVSGIGRVCLLAMRYDRNGLRHDPNEEATEQSRWLPRDSRRLQATTAQIRAIEE